MSVSLRYPIGSLLPDCLRSVVAAAASLAPALWLDLPGWVGVSLAALAAGCAAFGLATAGRARLRLSVSEDGIARSSLLRPGRGGQRPGRTFAWPEMTAMQLSYYSTRPDRGGGWMQLAVRFGRRRLVVDSRLEGFAELVRRAARVAGENGLVLRPATEVNLRALGAAGPGGPDARGPGVPDWGRRAIR